jgi:hypothetical protein
VPHSGDTHRFIYSAPPAVGLRVGSLLLQVGGDIALAFFSAAKRGRTGGLPMTPRCNDRHDGKPRVSADAVPRISGHTCPFGSLREHEAQLERANAPGLAVLRG